MDTGRGASQCPAGRTRPCRVGGGGGEHARSQIPPVPPRPPPEGGRPDAREGMGERSRTAVGAPGRRRSRIWPGNIAPGRGTNSRSRPGEGRGRMMARGGALKAAARHPSEQLAAKGVCARVATGGARGRSTRRHGWELRERVRSARRHNPWVRRGTRERAVEGVLLCGG